MSYHFCNFIVHWNKPKMKFFLKLIAFLFSPSSNWRDKKHLTYRPPQDNVGYSEDEKVDGKSLQLFSRPKKTPRYPPDFPFS